MIFEKSPIKRFTPPTCTLKLWDKRSFLARWRDNLTLDNLQFELHFDDPRLIEEEQVTLKGDHVQLALLHSVVGSYVQHFLSQTATCLGSDTDGGQDRCLAQITSSADIDNLESPSPSFLPADPPALSPQGLLSHNLNFGCLATHASHGSINLSASQLFDLLDALEAYSNNVLLLTAPHRTSLKQNIWVWGGATAVAIFALLVPTFGVQWYRELRSSNSTDDNSQTTDANQNSFLNVVPPVPPPPKEPLSQPELSPTLANRDPLPPPSQIPQGTPPPRNPNVAIQAPSLRVLPPPPVAPPAPPKPGTTNSAPDVNSADVPVHLLPNGEVPTVMPALPPETVAQMMTQRPNLPPPPALQARSPNASSSSDTLTIPNELLSDQAQVPVKPTPKMTLLDAIPQVAEARQYFQQRWQPPADLAQTLEYRLIVQPNGSLKQAIPLGKAAALYQPQTGMPAPGADFVSRLDVSNAQTLRLVLSPNGTVKTFLE